MVFASTGALTNDSDADTDPLKASLVTGVGHGVLVFNDDGRFTYTPAPDFIGADSFTYKVNDGLADSDTVTVTITVTPINDPPAANGLIPTRLSKVYALSGACIRTDGQRHRHRRRRFTAVSRDNVSHGTLALDATALSPTPPATDFAGGDSFTYKVNDGRWDSAAVTVTVTVTVPNPQH